ncbi:MAG TPA: ATPase, T2SS/T4P/T4SS family [Stenomitos sp.]
MLAAQNEYLAQLLVEANRLSPQQATTALAANAGEAHLAQLLVSTKAIRAEATRDIVAYQLRLAEGTLLADLGLVHPDQVEAAMRVPGETHQSLAATLLRQGHLSQAQLREALETMIARDYSALSRSEVNPIFLELLPAATGEKYQMIPVARIHDRLLVATPHPNDLQALDDVRVITGLRTTAVPTTEAAYHAFWRLDPLAVSRTVAAQAPEDPAVVAEAGPAIEDISADDPNAAPIVRLVNDILGRAIKSLVSDIHIEPKERTLLVRYRKDGLLDDAMQVPKHQQSAAIARLKIMCDLDVSEKRLPQDGKIRVKIQDNTVDLRVSTMPSQFGEKIVIRVLNRNAGIRQISELGFLEGQLSAFEQIIKSPQGIFFVTGPTGSGKTTTLYSALGHLQSKTKNIITIEDPIEYNFEHATQVQVNSGIDLTFARVLRAVLRQDPDIVLIGETRDHETAKIATEAALTGHLVLTSLHTNDATGAITRLVEMGIEPYLIGSAMLGAIAQRLVRQICPECREAYRADPEILAQMGLPEDTPLYRGKGCDACHGTGHQGRRAVYEVFVVEQETRELIVKGQPSSLIRSHAIKNGMVPIRHHAIELVREGVITFEEFVRVIYSDASSNEQHCPRCRNAIEESFSTCPFCKYVLNPSCPSCQTAVKPEWTVCPHCAEQLQLAKRICKSCLAELESPWVRCPFCFFEDSLL